MKTVLLQGAGTGAHDADAALADDLAQRLGHPVDFPRMPDEDDPDYEKWLPVIAEALADETVLVGHSLGGYFALRYLASHGVANVAGVFIIAAPFPGGDADWVFEGFDLPEGFGTVLADVPTYLYASADDTVVPYAHLALYERAIPGSVARTTTGGHQLGGDLSVVAADIRSLL